MKTKVAELITTLYQDNTLSKEELVYILDHIKQEEMELLFNLANATRKANYGSKVFLRGLIEFSNYCKRTCQYCGLRCANVKRSRFRLTKEEILACCYQGYELGFKTFVLQSGEDDYFTDEILTDIIGEIKQKFPDVAVTLSIGEKSNSSYRSYYEAGADRFLLRHETATKELYDKLHPGMSFANRRECLENIKAIGYQAGAGFIVGLPGQTSEILAENLVYLKEFKPHMIGIGPLIVHPDTPLKDCSNGSVEQTLICLALTRLLLPDVLLPSTTALNVLVPQGLKGGLQAGANVVMPNLTPVEERKKYELYQRRISADESKFLLARIEKSIEEAGYEVDKGRGDHKSFCRTKLE